MTLYARMGDASAARRITASLNALEQIARAAGGERLRSRGDDLLCVFDDPHAAFRTARAILACDERISPPIHGGLHHGRLVATADDIFGDVLNTTARLASKANAGEFLVSGEFVAKLAPGEAQDLQRLDRLRLRGKDWPVEVFALSGGGDGLDTLLPVTPARASVEGERTSPPRLWRLELRHGGLTARCADGQSLVLGRAPDCALQLNRPWISRWHAVVTLLDGVVTMEDRSTAGTFVAPHGERAFLVRREAVVLPRCGVISPAVALDDPDAEVVGFEVVDARIAAT
jgi:hypothetical protein